MLSLFFRAQNKIRTCTSLRTLPPEGSASTNFAIWASLKVQRFKGSMLQRFNVEPLQFLKSLSGFQGLKILNVELLNVELLNY